jgi:hypothetical protein
MTNRKLPLLIILCFVLSFFVACTNSNSNGDTDTPPNTPKPYADEMTFGFWMGVPNGVYRLKEDGSIDHTNSQGQYEREYSDSEMDTFYKDIMDAGFNVAFPECYNTSKNYNLKILKSAQKAGIRQFIQDGKTTNYLVENPDNYNNYKSGQLTEEQAVEIVKGYLSDYFAYDSFYALLVLDEPGPEKLERIGWAKQILAKATPNQLFYCTMPSVAAIAQGITDDNEVFEKFDNYLDSYLNLTGYNKFLCFDFYPLTCINDVKSIDKYWLRNICSVSEAITRFDSKNDTYTPMWSFMQAVGHNSYRELVSKADATFQAYTNMAYGAKGMFWFTYWAPNPGAENGYKDAMTDIYGNKTAVYDYIKKANQEISSISEVFGKYRWKSIMTSIIRDAKGTLKLLDDKVENKSNDLNSFSSTRNAILGIFADSAGKDAYLAVNFVEPSASQTDNTITLEIDNHEKAEVYIDGQKIEMTIVDGKLDIALTAGQGALVIPL